MLGNKIKWLVALLSAVGFVAPDNVEAQEVENSALPVVFVIMDTSGSMRQTLTQSSSAPCKVLPDGLVANRSRIAVARETLSGTIKGGGFCNSGSICMSMPVKRTKLAYDSDGGWTLKEYSHLKIMENLGMEWSGGVSECPFLRSRNRDVYESNFNTDGLIHRYLDSVRFGFAGFYSNRMGRLYSPQALINQHYKRNHTGLFDDDGQNGGPLIYPVATNDKNIVRLNNESIISFIRSFMVYGGTPLGPALADALHILTADPKTREQRFGNISLHDRNYDCAPKAVILITDGEPNAGTTNPGARGQKYKPEEDARRLREVGIKTYVVGYAFDFATDPDNVSQSVRQRAAYAINTLNKMAFEGGTCMVQGSEPRLITSLSEFVEFNKNGYGGICFENATGGDALKNSLDRILADMLSGTVSKTKPAVSNRISRISDEYAGHTSGQYEVYSGYHIEGASTKRKPILERLSYVCDNNQNLKLHGKLDFTEHLKKRLSDTSFRRNVLLADSTGLNAKEKLLKISDPNAGVLSERYVSEQKFVLEKDECPERKMPVLSPRTDGRYDSVSQNYVLLPFKCSVNTDCLAKGYTGRYCQNGQCLSESARLKSCMTAEHCDEQQTCLNKRCTGVSTIECLKHDDCPNTEDVCHLGKCLRGLIPDCSPKKLIKENNLGTVEYSNPVIVNGPEADYKDDSYVKFGNKYWKRDTMLYVGSNDGLLHAFILGKQNKDPIPSDSILEKGDYAEGDELWAYMPRSVVPRISKLFSEGGKQSYVNGQIAVSDLRVSHSYNDERAWATILVGGLRDGGNAYFALDVTDPKNPKFLWEISGKTPGFERLGFTYATPVLTQLMVNADGVDRKVPVAIFSGGIYGKGLDPKAGRALYIVNAMTGKLIRKFENYVLQGQNVANPLTVHISGTPGVFPSGLDTVSQRLYVGDGNAMLYRIAFDVSANPADWKLERVFAPSSHVFGSQSFEMAAHRPAITRMTVKNGNACSPVEHYVIAYNNGDPDNLADLKSQQAANANANVNFFALLSEVVPSHTNQHPSDIHVEYVYPPNVGNHTTMKITGETVFYNNVAIFPALEAPPQNQINTCSDGNASLWALDARPASSCISPFNPQTREPFPSPVFGTDKGLPLRRIALSRDTKVHGITVNMRPPCVADSPGSSGPDALGKAFSPQLIVQTGANAISDASVPANFGQGMAFSRENNTTGEVLKIDLPSPALSSAPVSWASSYN